jgi:riboflavin kinase / FMN adenylyltransferase
MKHINAKTKFIDEPMVLCLGTFDGLHLGHLALIDEGKRLSKQYGYKTCVYSFDNIPANFFKTDTISKNLFTHEEKIQSFEKQNIDYLWLDMFSNDIAKISAKDYIKYLSVVLNIKHVVVGFNYTFGHHAAGKTDDLIRFGKTFGFDVSVIAPVKIDDTVVSSTEIRKKILLGDITHANEMLSYPFTIHGTVVEGVQNGRKMNFPTINIIYNKEKILPMLGVYATKTTIKGKQYDSITNVGVKPTLSDEKHMTIETNIFDFDEMCYNEIAKVEFYKFIRQEKRFSSMSVLKAQITKDVTSVKQYFKENK